MVVWLNPMIPLPLVVVFLSLIVVVSLAIALHPPSPLTQHKKQAAVELQGTNQGRAAYHLLTQRMPHTRALHPVHDADDIRKNYDKVGCGVGVSECVCVCV